jgi:hypothetical protein
MNELNQALSILDDITADIEGRFPAGLYRVRRLLQDVQERYFLEDSDTAILAPDDPLADELVGDLPDDAA